MAGISPEKPVPDKKREDAILNVLYLINFAGKAGTEKYVENLIRILGKEYIKPFFAYNIPGELSKKMEECGVPCFQVDMGKKNSVFRGKKTCGVLPREKD